MPLAEASHARYAIADISRERRRRRHGYERARDLPQLLPLWPHEMRDAEREPITRACSRDMRRALRAERQRGLAGHWTYDLARHAQLLRAYRAEVAAYLHRAEPPRGQRSAAAHALSLTGRDESACARYFSRRVPRPIFLARSERARA